MPPLVLRRLKNKGINDIIDTKEGDYIFIKGHIPWNNGLTKETDIRVKKLGETQKKRLSSKEARDKLNKSHKGQIAWNKGLTKEIDERVMGYSKTKIGYHHTKKTRKKMSESQKVRFNSQEERDKISKLKMDNTNFLGHHHTEETKRKISEARKGSITSEETKRKISKAGIGKNIGKKHWNWQGGINSLHDNIRHNYKYRQWVSDVFTKDNFTCNICGERGCYLHAHHIKSFNSILQFYEITTLEEALNCAELWNINNGMTLCKDCHRRLHKKVR